MITVTISNRQMRLFTLMRKEFHIVQTGNRWDDLHLDNISYDMAHTVALNEPIKLEVEGDVTCCVIDGYLKGLHVHQYAILTDMIFGIISVTIPEQDDYVTAYDRAMAIVKR